MGFRRSSALILGAFLIVLGCARLPISCDSQTNVPAGPDLRRIREITEKAVVALNRGDIDTSVDLHTNDALVLAPNRPAAGKAAIRSSLERLLNAFTVEETRTI